MEQQIINQFNSVKEEEYEQARHDEDLTKLCIERNQESEERGEMQLKKEISDENTAPCQLNHTSNKECNISEKNDTQMLSNNACSIKDNNKREKESEKKKEDKRMDQSMLEIDQMKTSNKKNVVKNIMNAFKNFILEAEFRNTPKINTNIVQFYNQAKKDSEEDDLVQIIKKFKRYINSKNFNHYSMRLLILHPNYGPVLHYFLKGPILDWAQSCKANDLASHFAMVDFLLLSFKDISIIEELKRHEKKKAHYQ